MVAQTYSNIKLLKLENNELEKSILNELKYWIMSKKI